MDGIDDCPDVVEQQFVLLFGLECPKIEMHGQGCSRQLKMSKKGMITLSYFMIDARSPQIIRSDACVVDIL